MGLASDADPAKIPLVVILGPTAVGKSEIAIQLAERFNGEIVSADSRLFYRRMDIGTAKPDVQERLRVPHHLIDVADPDESWSLALFQLEANQVINKIYARHHLPFLVGGTGQFIRAIIEGWKVPQVHPNPRLRWLLYQWSEQIGKYELHAKLSILDPVAADTIEPSNLRRTVRALEVILSTGRRFSDQRSKGRSIYQPLLIGLIRPRSELYKRIDARISSMIDSGFIEEVRRLLDAGYSPYLPTMSAIGYGEIVKYLQGKITLDEAVLLMKRRTRVFVRRQANWFKEDDPTIQWFQVREDTSDALVTVIRNWLKSLPSNISLETDNNMTNSFIS